MTKDDIFPLKHDSFVEYQRLKPKKRDTARHKRILTAFQQRQTAPNATTEARMEIVVEATTMRPTAIPAEAGTRAPGGVSNIAFAGRQ